MKQQFLIRPDHRDADVERMAAFSRQCLPGKKLRVTVEEEKRTRSQQANAYLWGVCYAALEKSTGQPAEDWHEFFLGKWSGWEVVELFGQKKRKPLRRSSRLNRSEFYEYTELVCRVAAENGVYIAPPDPEYFTR